MSRQVTLTVRIGGTLSDFVAENVGEYVRDLIRRDRERVQAETFARLKAELEAAFAAPDATYRPLTAAEVIARARV